MPTNGQGVYVARRPATAVRVVRLDGDSAELLDCKAQGDGTLLASDGRQFSAELCRFVSSDVAVLAATPVQLLAEQQFHALRAQIAFSAVFENKSDWMEFARQAALFMAFAVALLCFLRLGTVDGNVSHLAGVIDAMQKAGK